MEEVGHPPSLGFASLTMSYYLEQHHSLGVGISRETKVEKMLTLAPERYTAGFRMVAKVILWCI